MNIHQAGNTVKITGTFNDWNGNKVNPETVKFMVYDAHYTKINEVTLDAANNTGVGEYFYDHVFDEAGDYVYEWFAQIGNTPSLKRERIRIVTV